MKTIQAIEFFQYDQLTSTLQPIELSELEKIDINAESFASMAEDKNGHIWLAFESGTLLEWNGKNVIERNIGKDITKEPTPQIWDIFFDKENNLWASSLTDGVCKYNVRENEEFHYSYLNGWFDGWRILSTIELNNGKFWIGTSAAGIQEFDPNNLDTNEVVVYNQYSGLPDDKINGMEVLPSGNVWIASSRGLIKYNTTYNHFKQFGKEHGLSNTFLQYGFDQLPTGELMIGQPEGFLVFDPSKTVGSSDSHTVGLSSFMVNGKEFATEKSIKFTEKIELDPRENYFTFHFSANYYDDQDQVKYRYILENYDRDWTETELGVAQANFTNVSSGHYVFKVVAANSEGNWMDTVTELPVIVHPYWYWSNAMKMIYGILLLGIVALIWKLQQRRWRLQNQWQLERTEATRLKELDGIKSRFFANVSHELRTPLTLMLGPISSLLKTDDLSNKQFTLLKTAQQSGNDLLKLVGSILDLSKIESGKLALNEQPQVLFPLIRRLVSNFESHAERMGIRFLFEYKISQRSRFEFDRTKMEIILNNLLSNALKFTQGGGRIIFKAEDLENVLQFSVEDTGRGIHQQDLPHVFDRFYQSQLPDAASEGGTGIGLAVSQEYVKMMGGKIWVESEWGKGSTFYFQIPRKEVLGTSINEEVEIEEKIDEHVSDVQAIPMADPKKDLHHSTILIVEDNYSLRNYLQTILSPHYNTILAENGQVALDMLSDLINEKEGTLPDLVLSDIMMPVMDGYQLIKVLRSKDYFRQIPVVVLTARADIQDRLQAFRIGVDDYLLKPFEEEELLVRIKSLLKNYSERKKFLQVEEVGSDKEKSISEERSISAEDQEWLEKLEKMILENMADSRFNMDFLGEKMFTSRRQLQRKIKKIVGLTPKEYINEIRLYEARQLLETGKLKSVKATAYHVGFSDPQYFSTQFKARFGKVPSAYLN